MSMQSSPSRNHVRNSQFHIPGQRLTKETECLAKETTSFDKKARLTKELRTAASHVSFVKPFLTEPFFGGTFTSSIISFCAEKKLQCRTQRLTKEIA